MAGGGREVATKDGDLRTLTCLDCNATAKFISADGAAYFKLMHAGHRVVEGGAAGSGPLSEAKGESKGGTPPSARRKGAFESMVGQDEAAGRHAAGHEEPHPEGREPKGQEEPPRKEEKDEAQSAGPPPPPEPSSQPAGERSTDQTSPAGPPGVAGQGGLLLSGTSFIESTPAAEADARRVSKALAKLRWNVTPPYTVSMVFSDILCITSESASIGQDLVELVEALGYSFSGFEANNSRPLAWFKKKEEQPPEPAPPPRPDAARLDELAKAIRDQATQIEREMAKIDEERKTVAEKLKVLPPEGEQG